MYRSYRSCRSYRSHLVKHVQTMQIHYKLPSRRIFWQSLSTKHRTKSLTHQTGNHTDHTDPACRTCADQADHTHPTQANAYARSRWPRSHQVNMIQISQILHIVLGQHVQIMQIQVKHVQITQILQIPPDTNVQIMQIVQIPPGETCAALQHIFIPRNFPGGRGMG